MRVWQVLGLFSLWSKLRYWLLASNDHDDIPLIGIPSVPFDRAGSMSFDLKELSLLVVDQRFAAAMNSNGATTIPPTLSAFAEVFQADLQTLGIDLPLKNLSSPFQKNALYLTLTNHAGFVDAAGRKTSEAYAITVTADGIVVAGASPLGVWWGTRTVMQQAVLGGMTLPLGTAVDAPGWGTRGIMLDAGRHFYTPSFLKEICAYISYFKQNTFHIHLSDDLFNNPAYENEQPENLYAAFRLNSDASALSGLVKMPNETYSQTEFEDLQQSCASRGVTIVPEIEAPGHAIIITQWKPHLALSTDASQLNITHPETIPTMKMIWKEFLPWFHSKSVHIGADEYDITRADDYNFFVNSMSSYIFQESGKNIRIWGTKEPGKTSSVSKNITIQHWEFSEDNPLFELLDEGYNVLNSDDSFYIVGGPSNYPQRLNLTRIFHGDPSTKGGGPFAPNIFDMNNATNNPPRSHPGVVGHIAAQWNDNGPNATTVLEAYYAWRDGLAALADKQWGGSLTEGEYKSVFEILQKNVPGQNLDRAIPSKSRTILAFNFLSEDFQGDIIRDSSGNGYDGRLHNATVSDGILSFPSSSSSVTTPLKSKGFNYTLSFSINPSTIGPIFTSSDSSLLNGNGSITNLTLLTGGNPYSLGYSLPMNTWTKVELIGRGEATLARVNDGEEMRFLAAVGVEGGFQVWKDIPIVAPLKRFGGFVGQMKDVLLVGEA